MKQKLNDWFWGAVIGGALVGFITYMVMLPTSITEQQKKGLSLLAQAKAHCEARAFSMKQFSFNDKVKPEVLKIGQVKYADAKAASDNLITGLLIKTISQKTDKEQDDSREVRALEIATNEFIAWHDNLVNSIQPKNEPRPPKTGMIEDFPGNFIDIIKLTADGARTLTDMKSKSDEQIINLIQRQTMLGLHELTSK